MQAYNIMNRHLTLDAEVRPDNNLLYGNHKMAYVHQSLKTTNNHIKYVPFLALGGLFIFTDSTQIYNFLSVIISFTLYPIVYGRIVEKIENDKTSLWEDLLAKHFGNYFLLSVIVIIPVMALNYLYSNMGYLEKAGIKGLVGASTQITTLYMWPLVFINKRVLRSIPQGFSSLMNSGLNNVPLILLILLTAIIKFLAPLSLIFIFQSKNIFLLYGVGYLQNLINVYIDLIVFSMAASMLLAGSNDRMIDPLVR